jgi:hypothetical protein
MSTKVFSFIIFPHETHHEPKASVLQCLKELAYATILKDLCTQARTSRNHRPEEKFSKQASWPPKMAKHPSGILHKIKEEMVEGIGHPKDRGKYGNFSFLFSAFNF